MLITGMASNFRRVFTSSVGTKLLIGLTGLALFAYLILHLAGNALIFLGPGTFNEYSHALISNPLIVPIEIGLLADLPAARLQGRHDVRSRTRRRGRCGTRRRSRAGHTSRKSLASSTMIVTGLGDAAVHHHPRQAVQVRRVLRDRPATPPVRDLYRDRGRSLQPRRVGGASTSSARRSSALHLRHGIASGFQSIGFDHPLYTRRLVTWGIVGAILDRRRARSHSASRRI